MSVALEVDFEEAAGQRLWDVRQEPALIITAKRHWFHEGKSIFFDRHPIVIGRIAINGAEQKIDIVKQIQGLIENHFFEQTNRILESAKEGGLNRKPYLMSYSVELESMEDVVSTGISLEYKEIGVVRDRASELKIAKAIEDTLLLEEFLPECFDFCEDGDPPVKGFLNYLWQFWEWDKEDDASTAYGHQRTLEPVN